MKSGARLLTSGPTGVVDTVVNDWLDADVVGLPAASLDIMVKVYVVLESRLDSVTLWEMVRFVSSGVVEVFCPSFEYLTWPVAGSSVIQVTMALDSVVLAAAPEIDGGVVSAVTVAAPKVVKSPSDVFSFPSESVDVTV